MLPPHWQPQGTALEFSFGFIRKWCLGEKGKAFDPVAWLQPCLTCRYVSQRDKAFPNFWYQVAAWWRGTEAGPFGEKVVARVSTLVSCFQKTPRRKLQRTRFPEFHCSQVCLFFLNVCLQTSPASIFLSFLVTLLHLVLEMNCAAGRTLTSQKDWPEGKRMTARAAGKTVGQVSIST